jgi:hypothetical protein
VDECKPLIPGGGGGGNLTVVAAGLAVTTAAGFGSADGTVPGGFSLSMGLNTNTVWRCGLNLSNPR